MLMIIDGVNKTITIFKGKHVVTLERSMKRIENDIDDDYQPNDIGIAMDQFEEKREMRVYQNDTFFSHHECINYTNEKEVLSTLKTC